MTGAIPERDRPDALAELRKVLESWPLYRKLTYQGGAAFVLPPQVRLFCSHCGGERNWQTDAYASGSGSGISRSAPPPTKLAGYGQKTYSCRDCGKRTVTYFYYHNWCIGGESTFLKVGQSPPLESHPAPDLEKRLGPSDAGLYRKALTSRNFNFGIGALAYLRRIVENRMNDLLDLIEEAAFQDGNVPDELKKVADVKSSWRFDEKITYAAKALPAHLKKGGINPIDFLHDLASEGLHNKTEEECIETFDRCRNAFEYAFRTLRVEIDDAKAYIATLRPDKK